MTRSLLAGALGALAMFVAISSLGAAPTKVAHSADVEARANEEVEYKFFVPSSGAAFTNEHEQELNTMGAQGWRVVSPIYSGGMLNSYLMMRAKR
ncbi:MAG: hypothetical protein JST54_10110 [Deltaproteobacteria bacterium]|nr:hypothetical protein [Deltaproteobacteria bacterium]